MSYSKMENHACSQCGVSCRFKVSYHDDGRPWSDRYYRVCQACQHLNQAEWYENAAKKHWQQYNEILRRRAKHEKSV